ncbi:MAG: DNA polymerase III subunit gamma/tau [Phycisphaerales bacterium]|nr:DNA polymerase III subunit gamma/tau [Phycisphaerales bacterium]
MAYTVLARRYRSQTFDEVVGQEAIARTLRNAVKAARVAHAYLFTGTRGVGKTSTARIFAKLLSGGSPEADAAIMSGQDTDVIEIDAASNTGVDNARDLIASSQYRPLRGKKKVYIIDEVHMLSPNAFNALLKTMEEPPEHVVFILCTTEAHKVPVTIQSRCQRFDFRAIPTAMIAEHLKEVVAQEGVKADADLLHTVARLGNGSMRDALSVMDRLLASGEKKLTGELLEELLGLPDRDLVSAIIDAFAAGSPRDALTASDELVRRGTALDQIIEALLSRLRDLLILSSCGPETELVDLAGPMRQQEAARAAAFESAGLVHMIVVCENVQRQARQSAVPRALFDAAMVRLAQTEKLADAAALVAGGGSPNGSARGGGGIGGGSSPAAREPTAKKR